MAKNYLKFIVEKLVVVGNHVTLLGKPAGAIGLMEAANAETPPAGFTGDGEVLVSVSTWLQK